MVRQAGTGEGVGVVVYRDGGEEYGRRKVVCWVDVLRGVSCDSQVVVWRVQVNVRAWYFSPNHIRRPIAGVQFEGGKSETNHEPIGESFNAKPIVNGLITTKNESVRELLPYPTNSITHLRGLHTKIPGPLKCKIFAAYHLSILLRGEIPLEQAGRKPVRKSKNKANNGIGKGRRDCTHVEMNSFAAGHV